MANTFGQVVKALRKKQGTTLDFVAKRIGSHKGYVSVIENEKVNPPSVGVVRKMFTVFKDTLQRAGLRDVTAEDFVELAWISKAPRLVRDRLMGRIQGNPLARLVIETKPGAPAVAAVPPRTNVIPMPAPAAAPVPEPIPL